MSKDQIIIAQSVVSPSFDEPIGNAVLVRNSRILAVGDKKDLMRAGQHVIDLGDAHLFPGFVESHAHLWWMGHLASQIDCGPESNGSVQDILDRVREASRHQPVGTWIQGHHWDDTRIAEGRPPTLEELTKTAPNHPVYLMHNSSHLAVANQMAFNLAGITPDTDIPGIVHDHHGKLTGLLLEATALESISRHIPLPSQKTMTEDIAKASLLCHRQGVTSCTDMAMGLGGTKSSGETVWRAYQAAEQAAQLAVRTTCYARVSGSHTFLPTENPTPFLTFSGVKLFSDGSIQGHTASLQDDYWDQPSQQGVLVHSRQDLREMIQSYHRRGLQVAIHANGDRAIAETLAAYRDVLGNQGDASRRHRIEHAQMARPEHIESMQVLGILPNFFIGHVYHWGDRHRDLFLGPHRAAELNPIKTAHEAGLRFALHSDAPVTPIDPLLSIATAVSRRTSTGHILGPGQAVPIGSAWRAYTTDAAYLGFREQFVGDIRPGLWADFVALSANPLREGPESLDGIQILQTIVGGQTVWQP